MRRWTSRNVYLDTGRSSVRLEPIMWDALVYIARAQGIDRRELVRRIDRSREQEENLSSALRVYIVRYFWTQSGG
jgi:predicted DNA-binding ribbon-helix-helix protein